eukprot:gene2889-3591_t
MGKEYINTIENEDNNYQGYQNESKSHNKLVLTTVILYSLAALIFALDDSMFMVWSIAPKQNGGLGFTSTNHLHLEWHTVWPPFVEQLALHLPQTLSHGVFQKDIITQ